MISKSDRKYPKEKEIEYRETLCNFRLCVGVNVFGHKKVFKNAKLAFEWLYLFDRQSYRRHRYWPGNPSGVNKCKEKKDLLVPGRKVFFRGKTHHISEVCHLLFEALDVETDDTALEYDLGILYLLDEIAKIYPWAIEENNSTLETLIQEARLKKWNALLSRLCLLRVNFVKNAFMMEKEIMLQKCYVCDQKGVLTRCVPMDVLSYEIFSYLEGVHLLKSMIFVCKDFYECGWISLKERKIGTETPEKIYRYRFGKNMPGKEMLVRLLKISFFDIDEFVARFWNEMFDEGLVNVLCECVRKAANNKKFLKIAFRNFCTDDKYLCGVKVFIQEVFPATRKIFSPFEQQEIVERGVRIALLGKNCAKIVENLMDRIGIEKTFELVFLKIRSYRHYFAEEYPVSRGLHYFLGCDSVVKNNQKYQAQIVRAYRKFCEGGNVTMIKYLVQKHKDVIEKNLRNTKNILELAPAARDKYKLCKGFKICTVHTGTSNLFRGKQSCFTCRRCEKKDEFKKAAYICYPCNEKCHGDHATQDNGNFVVFRDCVCMTAYSQKCKAGHYVLGGE